MRSIPAAERRAGPPLFWSRQGQAAAGSGQRTTAVIKRQDSRNHNQAHRTAHSRKQSRAAKVNLRVPSAARLSQMVWARSATFRARLTTCLAFREHDLPRTVRGFGSSAVRHLRSTTKGVPRFGCSTPPEKRTLSLTRKLRLPRCAHEPLGASRGSHAPIIPPQRGPKQWP
jgi:hypothetical protein